MSLLCAPAQATHIQYVELADVRNVSISEGISWEWKFDLTSDEMDLWELASPTETYGPTPTTTDANYIGTGSYDLGDALHYVTLRINPNNKNGVSTSNYISLTVNNLLFTDWTNPIRLYDWGIPGDDVSNVYGIAPKYQIIVTLTGLSTLKDKAPIAITNVNLEGCFDTAVPVPEPATMLLFGTGLVGLAGVTRRKLKK